MSGSVQVKQIHGGGYLQCATWLIEAPGGVLLVDPGSGSAEKEVLTALRSAGYRPGDLRAVVLTHCHVDHARGAYRFRDWGVPLMASPAAASALWHARREVWYEYPDYVIPTEVDALLSDGQDLHLGDTPVHVIYTPGHTVDSVSLLVRAEDGLVALTGDLVTDQGHPGWAGSDTFSREDTLASLRKLIAEQPDRACWGHGPIEGPAVAWLEHALALGEAGDWQLRTARNTEVTPPPEFSTRALTAS